MVTDEPDVLVVGAGLSGMAVARQLAARGLRCEVLEAGSQPVLDQPFQSMAQFRQAMQPFVEPDAQQWAYSSRGVPFQWNRVRAAGGRSLLWGGLGGLAGPALVGRRARLATALADLLRGLPAAAAALGQMDEHRAPAAPGAFSMGLPATWAWRSKQNWPPRARWAIVRSIPSMALPAPRQADADQWRGLHPGAVEERPLHGPRIRGHARCQPAPQNRRCGGALPFAAGNHADPGSLATGAAQRWRAGTGPGPDRPYRRGLPGADRRSRQPRYLQDHRAQRGLYAAHRVSRQGLPRRLHGRAARARSA
ncbi:NAD(P)-binding protein [Pseudomonas sp. MAFF212427]|uniref:NAD(P)-binding protein n=1 Tax=Pseudomonas brassicae TaxID=2708063 RepID=A0A6B3NYW8_9PSED|nr:NAD(P)-binding protein [Pseudomonas brassicae]